MNPDRNFDVVVQLEAGGKITFNFIEENSPLWRVRIYDSNRTKPRATVDIDLEHKKREFVAVLQTYDIPTTKAEQSWEETNSFLNS